MIETVDLTKKYGDFFALESLTLKLEQGDLFGFIGPNGAGKTTTIRILSTLLSPSWGEASVCGILSTHIRVKSAGPSVTCLIFSGYTMT